MRMEVPVMPAKTFVLLVLLASVSGCSQDTPRAEVAATPSPTTAYNSVMLALPVGNAQAGRQAFLDLKCTTCHRIRAEEGFPAPFSDSLGPDLDARPPHRTPSDLATAIVAPSHAVSTGIDAALKTRLEGVLSPMGDFNQAMTVRQLSDMVAYLRSIPATP